MVVAHVLKAPFRYLLGTILLVVSPPLAAAGMGDAVQSPLGAAGLALIETVDGYSLEDVAGTRRRITVAEGTRLSAIRQLDNGWIAAGSISLDRVSDLVLIRQLGPVQEAISAPLGETARLRLNPEPLVESGELVGVAWLEGDDGEANAVRAASWNGGYWGAIETVAPAVHEAQLALSSAVLDDGSWLLVWAAYQEGDDDIFWSRRHGGRWSEPQTLHTDNDVPDIVPAVAAVPGGALAAWSWFAGDSYRLMMARFDGAGWLDTGFLGEKGSLHPSLVQTDVGARLLYRTSEPDTWTLLDLAFDGRVERRAIAERESEPRPIVDVSDPGSVALRWLADSVAGLGVRREAVERRVEWVPEF